MRKAKLLEEKIYFPKKKKKAVNVGLLELDGVYARGFSFLTTVEHL